MIHVHVREKRERKRGRGREVVRVKERKRREREGRKRGEKRDCGMLNELNLSSMKGMLVINLVPQLQIRGKLEVLW